MIHFCFTHRGNHNQKKFMIIMLHILKGKKTVFCLRNCLLFDEKIKPLDRNFYWFSPQTYLQKQSSFPPSSLPQVWFLLIASFKVLGFSCNPIDSPVTDPFSLLRARIHCSPLLLHLLDSLAYFTGFGYIKFIETSDYTICQYFLTLKCLTLTFFWNSDFYGNIPSALVLLNITKKFLLMLIFIFLYFFLWKIYFFHTICYDYRFIFSNFSEILPLALLFKFTPFLSLARKQTSREQ